MSKRAAQHRAACRPITPVTEVMNAISESGARRKVATVAISGVTLATVVGAAVPATATGTAVAPATVDTAALATDLVDEVSSNPEIAASDSADAPFVSTTVSANVDTLSEMVAELANQSQRGNTEVGNTNSASREFKIDTADLAAGSRGSAMLAAALAQIGRGQDCTALVENALRAIGYSAGDLGTGIWQYDQYGSRVSPGSLAPGDIVIYGNASSGTHVSIYAGNGQAVHGGYQGSTMIAPVTSAYQPITGAIRVR